MNNIHSDSKQIKQKNKIFNSKRITKYITQIIESEIERIKSRNIQSVEMKIMIKHGEQFSLI